MKLSVIIPSYNPDLNKLMKCIKAIHSSTLKPFEVILVDDGSTINYLEKVKPYCKVIKNKKNSGPAYTRNRGAKKSKGDILCFIDSDILIKRDTLEKISKKFNDKEVSAVQTIYTKFTPIPNFLSQYQNLYQHYIFRIVEQKHLDSISSHCIAVRRKAFFDVGGFDEDVKNTSVEDEHLGIALSSKGYNILLTKDIEVEHLAYFNLSKIIKRMFRIASARVEYTIKKPETRKMDLRKTHHPIYLLVSILMSPLILLSLMTIILPFVWILVLSLISIFLLVNLKFFRFLYKNKGIRFMLKSIVVYYLVCLSLFFGFIKGGFNAISSYFQ